MPGQEEAAAKTIVRSWLGMDPEWALDWMSRKFSVAAALAPLQESLLSDIQHSAVLGLTFNKDIPARLKRCAGLLHKLNPTGAEVFLNSSLDQNVRGEHVEAVRKRLKP